MTAAVDALGLVGSTIEQVRFDACVDSGGFGLVYRGRHLGMDEPVAIKCLRIASMQRTDAALREAIAARFRDEMKLLYRLSAGTLDVVRCIGGGVLVAPRTNEITPYMVLEWLEGKTLALDLRERREQAGAERRRSLLDSVRLLDAAASGLAYAHAQGIVHRDIKPGNLFLTKTRDGTRCKVLDFGLAKILSDEGLGMRPSVETASGVHFCSPSYGAPEQFSPSIGPVGPWTDVYSLTLVLLEMVLGDKVRPAGTLAEGLLKALEPATGSPTPKSLGLSLGTKLEDLFTRAVAMNPLARPRDAGAFWGALRELLHEAPRPDLAMTVADADVAAAMRRVRELQGSGSAPPTQPPQSPPALAQPSPFAGTMLMVNAPSGAPHLLALEPQPPLEPRPSSQVPPGQRPSTLPLGARAAGGYAAPAPAPAAIILGAASPLASSVSAASGPPSPVSPLPPRPAAPTAPAPRIASVPPSPMPRSLAPPERRSGGAAVTVAIVLVVLAAIGAGALAVLRMRH